MAPTHSDTTKMYRTLHLCTKARDATHASKVQIAMLMAAGRLAKSLSETEEAKQLILEVAEAEAAKVRAALAEGAGCAEEWVAGGAAGGAAGADVEVAAAAGGAAGVEVAAAAGGAAGADVVEVEVPDEDDDVVLLADPEGATASVMMGRNFMERRCLMKVLELMQDPTPEHLNQLLSLHDPRGTYDLDRLRGELHDRRAELPGLAPDRRLTAMELEQVHTLRRRGILLAHGVEKLAEVLTVHYREGGAKYSHRFHQCRTLMAWFQTGGIAITGPTVQLTRDQRVHLVTCSANQSNGVLPKLHPDPYICVKRWMYEIFGVTLRNSDAAGRVLCPNFHLVWTPPADLDILQSLENSVRRGVVPEAMRIYLRRLGVTDVGGGVGTVIPRPAALKEVLLLTVNRNLRNHNLRLARLSSMRRNELIWLNPGMTSHMAQRVKK